MVVFKNYSCSYQCTKYSYLVFTLPLTIAGIFTTSADIKNASEEILKMRKFSHPNVMSLIGVCLSPSEGTNSAGLCIVMPYMAKGSLLDHLRKEGNKLQASSEDEVYSIFFKIKKININKRFAQK